MENTTTAPGNGFSDLKKYFKDDLVSGFGVSLIALPLCLGISIASGFPPMAGLITAIVGGMLASRISGTFVTISGPAAGLIVISLGAVESMGGAGAETGFAGYPHALGSILVAGLIVTLFGLLKVGKVGDYFPSAAVHGMLAAIGVIIIIKQIYPAIGVKAPKGEILEVAAHIPQALAEVNFYSLSIALTALAILIAYPFLKIKLLKVVPAPMWVLLVTIPLARVLGTEHLNLVDMPESLLGPDGIKFPSFEKIGEGAFWAAVMGFALVSGIETLLSAKAVDSLDPYKRKSNLDGDLISMGAGSSLAAAIGGLPMISEIVRSSANISNGGKTQWANFFHGTFLLIFLVAGSFVIEMIPVAALAAMLVFTGFRLASPKEFKHMFKMGVVELEIFIITLVAVLATDLIVGILIGILVKYALLMYKGVKMRELFKSHSTVVTKEHLQIFHLEGAQIFSNYLSLKKKMDGAVQNCIVLDLDFSDVTLVDNTVMEHLEEYARELKQKGKELHLVNIDALNPVSEHPLAERDRNAKRLHVHEHITERQLQRFDFAAQHNHRFRNIEPDTSKWEFYTMTIRKQILKVENVVSFETGGTLTFRIADVYTAEGALLTSETGEFTGLKIAGISNVPKFSMQKETAGDRIAEAAGAQDIDFVDFPVFSDFYLLKGTDEAAVRRFFTPELLSFFEAHSDYYLVGNGSELLLHKGEHILGNSSLPDLINVAKLLCDLLNKAAQPVLAVQ